LRRGGRGAWGDVHARERARDPPRPRSSAAPPPQRPRPSRAGAVRAWDAARRRAHRRLGGGRMRVAFRLDASRSVGLGHLSRSSNLARALEQRGAHVSFVVGGEGGVELARTWLPPSMPVSPAGADQDDLPTLVAHVEQAGADVVIVDHYGLSSSYLRALRA